MGDKDVRSVKNIGVRLWSLYLQGEFGIQPNVDMNIGLMANVLKLVTMSEERIIEEKNGRLEKGECASKPSLDGSPGSVVYFSQEKKESAPKLPSYTEPSSVEIAS